MSNCNECIYVNPIPTCAVTWDIGSVDATYDGLELTYRVTDFATGRITEGLTETIAAPYNVVITLPDDLTELMVHYYKVELFEQGSTEAIEITIDTESSCCVQFTTVSTTGTDVIFSTIPCLTS